MSGVEAFELAGYTGEINERYRYAWVEELGIADSYDEWGPPEKMAPKREPAAPAAERPMR